MLAGLQAILEKEVVLSTVNANDLLHNPLKVESDYQRHVQTFIPMGDINDYSNRLAKMVMSAKTPKGLIVAPYGYGKTSTLAFLWHECEKQELLTVPPFYCANLLDILKATYGWVKFRLQQREPALIADLEAVYYKYTAATVEEMAKQYAQEHGLAAVTAVNLLNDMLAKGSLVLELTPTNLLFFLDGTTNLVLRAGFKGLTVLPDEFQQYFSKGANLRHTIQEFREFVWGLDTRANSIGVVFSIPTYAEANIQDHGKDIVHRLKKDNLYYRLQDIYTREFPAQLWQRYVESFGLGSQAGQVMDDHTLQAIGQIAEREELGEGPRTVIDSLKRAILHYQDHHQAYTPIHLIDDFLESNINFQSQANRIKTVTRQALDSAIVNTPEKRQAVKLLAAFPQGCSTTIQKKYQLYEVVNALSKHAHGELMTLLAEGYTLLGLSRISGATRTTDVIITRFWKSFEEDEIYQEAATHAFIGRLLPRFFEQRRGAAPTGWGKLEFANTARGGYLTILEGSFNPRYPRRRLALQVAYKIEQLQPLTKEADLQFDFLFHLGKHEDTSNVALVSERQVRFNLNLKQKLGPILPEDLRKLQEFVNPEFVSPLLMLGLVNYFDRWEEMEEQPIPESDRSEIEHFIGRLINHTIEVFFSQEMINGITPPMRRIGRFMLDELFNRLCHTLYKNYHTFFVHAQYEKVFNDYINAMRSMTLKERRGHTPLSGAKEALAKRFGVLSVATFETRLESDYSDLVEKAEWLGRGEQSTAEIKLKLHPLEEEILQQLRTSLTQQSIDGRTVPILTSNQVADLARGFGYRDDETFLALQLLASRGYTRFDAPNKMVYLAQVGPDSAELQARVKKLTADLITTADLLLPNRHQQFQKTLATLQSRLAKPDQDDEELDELQTRISDLNQQISDTLTSQRDELHQQLNALTLEVDRALVGLRSTSTLDREIQGQVAFVMHLNELRQSLSQEQRRLTTQYTTLKQTVTQAISQTDGGPITEMQRLYQARQTAEQQKEDLFQKQQTQQTQVGHLEQWIKLLKECDLLFNTLSRLPDLRQQLTQQVVPEIQAHFTKHRLDKLADWEIFRAKVQVVEADLEKRRRHGNETFSSTRERYEQVLRETAVGDYRPVTRYTYGEDEDSYQDLYAEVRNKLEKRLDEMEADLAREQTDLLKIQYIHLVMDENRPLIQRVSKQLTEAAATTRQLRKALTLSLIQQGGDELTAFSTRLKELAKVATEARGQLGPILHANHKLSPEEQKVLQALGTRSDMDLTELFVNLHQEDKTLTLTSLLAILENLYRKNRLTIRIRSRG